MAFPFDLPTQLLRQRLLVAIGSGGLLGLGCASSMPQQNPGQTTGLESMGGGGGAGAGGGLTATAGAAGSRVPVATDAAVPDAMMTPSTTVLVCPSGAAPMRVCYPRAEMESKARFGCGQIALAPVPSDAQIASMFLANGCLVGSAACDGCCNPAAAEGEPVGDGSCCYQYCGGACCGRPLLVAGESRIAATVRRGDWLPAVALSGAALAADGALLRRIAHEWLEDARMEHASIASFARFTLELLSFGAPSELVELAQRAALDEVEHARACFALAQRHDGIARGPAPLPLADVRPAATLRASVRSAFLEGCVGETQAAALAQAACARAGDPEVRRALERIAEDETRHAELAWRYVAWALRQDATLAGELQDALAAVRGTQPACPPEHEPAATRAALHAAGRLTEAERAELARSVLSEVIAPCSAALLSEIAPRAPARSAAA